MDLQDGFIVGIFNYCDRWCETCAFTSRCRLFADIAALQASVDPNLKPVLEAPPLPQDVPPPPPPWLEEMLGHMDNASAEDVTIDDLKDLLPAVPAEHKHIETRARAYAFRAGDWLTRHGFADRPDLSDPRSVLARHFMLIATKTYRALIGRGRADWDDDWPRDHDGSAKVALIAIERSHAAWLALAERGEASMADAAPCIEDLIWLGDEIDRVFPDARAFVRPGFDEPDAVAKLTLEP